LRYNIGQYTSLQLLRKLIPLEWDVCGYPLVRVDHGSRLVRHRDTLVCREVHTERVVRGYWVEIARPTGSGGDGTVVATCVRSIPTTVCSACDWLRESFERIAGEGTFLVKHRTV
jgi:hypothetical protein